MIYITAYLQNYPLYWPRNAHSKVPDIDFFAFQVHLRDRPGVRVDGASHAEENEGDRGLRRWRWRVRTRYRHHTSQVLRKMPSRHALSVTLMCFHNYSNNNICRVNLHNYEIKKYPRLSNVMGILVIQNSHNQVKVCETIIIAIWGEVVRIIDMNRIIDIKGPTSITSFAFKLVPSYFTIIILNVYSIL